MVLHSRRAAEMESSGDAVDATSAPLDDSSATFIPIARYDADTRRTRDRICRRRRAHAAVILRSFERADTAGKMSLRPRRVHASSNTIESIVLLAAYNER